VNESKAKGLHKRMLLMSLSHEFRNPLNGNYSLTTLGLLTMLPLLREKLEDAMDQYQVDAVITCARYLTNYVNNFLVLTLR
jgi:K+-sensing histidine kinase KdpD